MPRKNTINSPKKIPTNSSLTTWKPLSTKKIDKIVQKYPDIPNNFNLHDSLINIYDTYQRLLSRQKNKFDQSKIQQALLQIDTYSDWLAEQLSGMRKFKNKSISEILFTGGFCMKVVDQEGDNRKIHDMNRLESLTAGLRELSDVARKAHHENIGKRNTKDYARDYLLIKLKELWESATGKKAVMSLTSDSRKANKTTDTMNCLFGNFAQDVVKIFGYRLQSASALKAAFKRALQ